MTGASAWLADALAAHRAGRLAEAERLYRLALRADSGDSETQHLLGLLMHQTGRSEAGAALIRRAVSADGVAQHRLSLAGILAALRRPAEAATELRRLAAEQPADAETLLALAGTMRTVSGPFDAAAWAGRTLAVRGDYAEAAYNRGNWLQTAGDETGAAAAYRRALAIREDYADALANLAPTLLGLGRPSAAWRAAAQAIALSPAHAAAHNNRGQAMQAAGLTRAATCHFARALAIDPHLSAAHSNLLFSLSYAPETSHAALFAAYRRWAKQHAPSLPAVIAHTNDRDANRRLRVGYLSADLSDHPVGHSLIGLIEGHDPARTELIAYAAVPRPDAMTARFRRAFRQWRDLQTLDDDQAAALIRRDAVDVLVCVAGRTANNRLLVTARKPAPVQASLYDLTTTGLETIDAWFTDPVLHPAETGERFVERLVRLPCLHSHELPSAPLPGPVPSEAAGLITFGSCNNPAKLTEEVIRLWARALAAVPNSRLLLKYQDRFVDPELRDRFAQLFAEAGIGIDRLVFVGGRMGREAQLKVFDRVDIALDPFPFNGSTATLEALWMGVPVVALAGDRLLGRVAMSFLVHLGLPSLVAATPEEYVAIARRLALDQSERVRLRTDLRLRLRASPMLDPVAHARALEEAYRMLWQDWCRRR